MAAVTTPSGVPGVVIEIGGLPVRLRVSDPEFIALLSNLRVGSMNLREEAALKRAHYRSLPVVNGVGPTKLNALKVFQSWLALPLLSLLFLDKG